MNGINLIFLIQSIMRPAGLQAYLLDIPQRLTLRASSMGLAANGLHE
jgi:hypothetical protein